MAGYPLTVSPLSPADGRPFTVSLYVTSTPLPAGADPSASVPVLGPAGNPVLDANGMPLARSASLVDRAQVPSSSQPLLPATSDPRHEQVNDSDIVPDSSLTHTPDG